MVLGWVVGMPKPEAERQRGAAEGRGNSASRPQAAGRGGPGSAGVARADALAGLWQAAGRGGGSGADANAEGASGSLVAVGAGTALQHVAPAGEPTDEELVQRMREGESAAGEMLCRRYFTPLMRYLERLTRSGAVAEELFQQTWLSVIEHLDRFDPAADGGGFKAWLFRIATNKSADHWRALVRTNRAIEQAARKDAEVRTAGEHAEQNEAIERLRRAIQLLPEGQRQVVFLRYYTGMKFVEIARMLGCPLNTALGRMHKAILRLRAALEPSAGGVSSKREEEVR